MSRSASLGQRSEATNRISLRKARRFARSNRCEWPKFARFRGIGRDSPQKTPVQQTSERGLSPPCSMPDAPRILLQMSSKTTGLLYSLCSMPCQTHAKKPYEKAERTRTSAPADWKRREWERRQALNGASCSESESHGRGHPRT